MAYLRSTNRRAFTLVEMVIVIAIIIVILAIAIPAINTMRHQAHLNNINLRIENMIKLAKARSEDWCTPLYGVMFYVDESLNKQVAVFIVSRMWAGKTDGSFPDIYGRFQIDPENQAPFYFPNFVRIRPFESLEWTTEQVFNNDQTTGMHRNFYAIIFQDGKRASMNPIFLYDEDGDGDELGDITKFRSVEIRGDFSDLPHTVVNENDEKIEIPTYWNFMVYDENLLQEVGPGFEYLIDHSAYGLNRQADVIRLDSP